MSVHEDGYVDGKLVGFCCIPSVVVTLFVVFRFPVCSLSPCFSLSPSVFLTLCLIMPVLTCTRMDMLISLNISKRSEYMFLSIAGEDRLRRLR